MTNPKDAFRQDAEQDAGEHAEAWIPDVGDLLVGEVAEYSEGSTKHGSYHIVTVRDEDSGKTWAVWLLHKILEAEFDRLRPKVGERISIKRHKDGCTTTGTKYKRYRLRVDRPAVDAPDFGKFTRADDMPPGDARQVVEDTREAVESQRVEGESRPVLVQEAMGPSTSQGFAEVPEALDDDGDDLPF